MKISNKIEKVQDFNFFNNELVLKTTNDDIYKGNIKFSFKGRPYAILENRNFCDIQEEEVDFYDLGFNQLTNIKKKGVIAGSRVFNTDYFSIRWEDNKGNDFLSVKTILSSSLQIGMFRPVIQKLVISLSFIN